MKRLIVLLALLPAFIAGFAQETYNSSGSQSYYYKKTHKSKRGYDPSKLIIGGNITLSYGTDAYVYGIAPMVGYQFGRNFSAGISLGYQNSGYNITFVDQYGNTDQTQKTTESIINPGIWGRYFFYRSMYAIANFEYDLIGYKEADQYFDQFGNSISTVNTNLNVTAPCLLLGIGVREKIGGRFGVYMELMYDVLQQQYSPYFGIPTMRGGLAVGL